MNIEYIKDSGLTIAAKGFLFELLLSGFEIEVYDSFSELFFSKGFVWVRESDSFAYYAEKFESLKAGTKIALVRRELIRDLDMSNAEDREQIREAKDLEETLEDLDETR